VRGVALLDYTPGGPDFLPDLFPAGGAPLVDIGAGDEIHGESGDDFAYGMVGRDVLFGDSEDDDLIGGWGADWFSGGTGGDGVLGDDGRIFTARYIAQGTGAPGPYAEPLLGVLKVDQVDKPISTPGNIQTAVINPAGELYKSVDLTPFNLTPNVNGMDDPLFEPVYADDIVYGGLGNDFLHGGAGDDAISGAEALPAFFDQPVNPGDVLRFDANRVEFADYDENDPRLAPDPFFLGFSPAGDPDPAEAVDDAFDEDVIFGDLGNDWLVGGPDNDTLYGGYGADLLDADDDRGTNGGLNDMPDLPNVDIQDRAFGGAGRDVLMANSGGDRLIDWAGEFNSYLVPFAPFGPFTVSRGVPPALFDFLYALSASHGADPTRVADTGNDPARNAEPDGEIGLVTPKDGGLWRDQTGAPADPQAGNIPGGPRLTLRGVDFNSGTAVAFAPDSGSFRVSGGRLEVAPEELVADIDEDGVVGDADLARFLKDFGKSKPAADLNGDGVVGGPDFGIFLGQFGEVESDDAVSVLHVGEYLPAYFEVAATINAGKPTGGLKSNSYLIFDYQGPEDFKFAGVDISIDKLVMGHRDAEGWHVDVQTPAQLRPDTDYRVLLAINGVTATVVVDNEQVMSHVFEPRVDADGFTYGLNRGMVGIGAYDSVSRIDNVEVRILKPEITFEDVEDFEDGVADRLTGVSTGAWTLAGGRLDGAPLAGEDFALRAWDLSVGPNSTLELEATLTTEAFGGFFFDHYGEQDYKFAAIAPAAGQVVIGHWSRGGVALDAVADLPFATGAEVGLRVSLSGTTLSVAVDGHEVLGHVFNAVVVDGDFGLLARGGASSFDAAELRTDDVAFSDVGSGERLVAARAALAPSVAPVVDDATLSSMVDEAIRRWDRALTLDEDARAELSDLTFQIADLNGLILGSTGNGIVWIDRDAAGHGWFVDETPERDEEYRPEGSDGVLSASLASDAASAMDLLSVVTHEIGHAIGVDTHALLGDTLDVGERVLPAPTSASRVDAAASLEYAVRVLAAETRAEDDEDDGFAEFEIREIPLEPDD
jgi:Ca2+-binding RTX toxin-like protein